jgi:hypothetical protein
VQAVARTISTTSVRMVGHSAHTASRSMSAAA